MACNFIGVYPALTTKLNEQEQIDFSENQKGIKAQLDAGVHGVIIGGTLGEASTLTTEEKHDLPKDTINYINKKYRWCTISEKTPHVQQLQKQRLLKN